MKTVLKLSRFIGGLVLLVVLVLVANTTHHTNQMHAACYQVVGSIPTACGVEVGLKLKIQSPIMDAELCVHFALNI